MPHRESLNPEKRLKARRRARANLRLKGKLLREQYIKEHGPCCKCGLWNKLEFDHITRHGLGVKRSRDMWIWGTAKRNAELVKCQILCRLCHRMKSSLEQRKYDHGLNFYERHGCRCDICKEANASKKREVRRRKHALGIPWSQIY